MQHDAEQRREQIVEAACAIVDQGGANALTAQAVTKAVGVSRPLLYHYFDTMEALLDVVIDRHVERFAAVADEWAAGTRTSTEPLDSIVTSAVEALRPQLVDKCPLVGSNANQISPAYMGYLARCSAKLASLIDGDSGALARRLRETGLDSTQLTSMLVFGACGTAITSPETPDDVLVELILAMTASPAPATEQPPAAPATAQPAAKGGLFQRIFGGR